MTPPHIVQLIFAAAGLTTLLAAAFDWDWFFLAQNLSFLIRRLGRPRTRLLYAILGIAMLLMAISL
jgi:hypothetical protein